MIRILGKPTSINVRKVLWTCQELDVAVQQESWGAGSRSTAEPEFLALNPNAMVPVLCDGDFVLWESNAICRYLANENGGRLLYPASARERALVDQWMDWQATELNNSWRYAFMALVRHSEQHRDAAAIAASIAAWNRHMGIVERQLAATDAYLTGPQFTLADIVIGLSANRWNMTPMERPDYPALTAYLKRLEERPGYREFGNNGTA